MTIVWRTSCAEAAGVADHIASRLAEGYEELTPDGAELVSMTPPAGLDDLSK